MSVKKKKKKKKARYTRPQAICAASIIHAVSMNQPRFNVVSFGVHELRAAAIVNRTILWKGPSGTWGSNLGTGSIYHQLN